MNYRYVVEHESMPFSVVCETLPVAMQFILDIAAKTHPHHGHVDNLEAMGKEYMWENILPLSVAEYVRFNALLLNIQPNDQNILTVYADLIFWANNYIKENMGWSAIRVRQLPYYKSRNYGKEEREKESK